MNVPRLHPVILAGGSGTRFWPLSRQKRPKQLLPLASNEPLIADTVARLAGLAAIEDVLTVCGKAHASSIRKRLPEAARDGVLVEPVPRNTAAAIALAAAVVRARDPEGVMLVLPSDHAVIGLDAFHRTMRAAAAVAARGPLVTVGVPPTRPETGFGYLRVGPAHRCGEGAREVLAFVEKPDLERAKSYLDAGDYFWNAGMFAFRADRILEELDRHLPALGPPLAEIAAAVHTPRFVRAVNRFFPACPSISIDYAVMEKADDIAVVPAEFGWSDLGSFASVPEVREADAAGNVATGDVLLLDAARNVVLGEQRRPIAVVGANDLVIVDAGDAILVCHRDRAQDVRKVVDALASRGDRKLL